MSQSATIIEEFELATLKHVEIIYEAIRDCASLLGQVDETIDRHVARRKLTLLVFETLMHPFSGSPQYDLTLIPEWMREVARSQGANPESTN